MDDNIKSIPKPPPLPNKSIPKPPPLPNFKKSSNVIVLPKKKNVIKKNKSIDVPTLDDIMIALSKLKSVNK